MDSKQVAFTINGNEEFQLLFKRPENNSTNLNHSKNKVHVRMVHDGSKQMNRKVINIIIKNSTSVFISVNQRLSNVIFSHTDGCQGKIVDLLNVPYFVNQKALQTLVKENSYSSDANAKHLLRQEALIMHAEINPASLNLVRCRLLLKVKDIIPFDVHERAFQITPFYNVEAKKESGNESIAYEAIIILGKRGEFKACGHCPENAFQNVAQHALLSESFKNEIKILSKTGDVDIGACVHEVDMCMKWFWCSKTTASENDNTHISERKLNLLLHLALEENIIPVYEVSKLTVPSKKIENYEVKMKLAQYGSFSGCVSSLRDALESASHHALMESGINNKMMNLLVITQSATNRLNNSNKYYFSLSAKVKSSEMKKTTAAYNVDQQNVKLLMNFQIVLDLALSENIIPMYYELSSSNKAQETENHQYILILEKYGNFYGTGSSKADALEDAAGQALSSDVLKNKMKNSPGIVVAADDPSVNFAKTEFKNLCLYAAYKLNVLNQTSILPYTFQISQTCLISTYQNMMNSMACIQESCTLGMSFQQNAEVSPMRTVEVLVLKQWLPNLRWYACLLPNKRHKTRLLNQISANYEKMRKPGIFKLIYRKNNNVNCLENILKVHKVNFTMTVSKGDLEVHIARCKVEKNGFSLIAEVVQKTQRDALELSAFTALEILLYSNMFPDVGNTIRSTLLKADPSV
ncbi:hypothetical protein T11_16003 [Trichinella zimbabwensis]|uniref:Uncharacterized protein n=1 Tax=Trichinella zimbabwensis TaxID=268475 RepID=A0A0V1H4Z5_9BILA|nr:hypothetical protein T11_16003 [Trichinella zimbabwensis]